VPRCFFIVYSLVLVVASVYQDFKSYELKKKEEKWKNERDKNERKLAVTVE
jgi:hypothetical protein